MPRSRRPANPYTVRRLPNGLRIILRPQDNVDSVSLGLWVRAGGRFESPELAGTSHFLEHLVFKGTKTRSCNALKQLVEGIGGTLNAFTAEEFTCYMAKVPPRYLDRAVTALTDMALHPSMAERDIALERDVILEEIRMVEDTPAQYIHDILNQLMWPNHPLGNLLAGTEDSVKRIARPVLRQYWRRFYHPSHMLIACVGAFDPDRLQQSLRRAFNGARTGAAQRGRPVPRARRGPHIRVVHKTSEQTHLCLGTRAMPRTHPQRFALELLHVLLGGNMSSRLFNEVREKRGLVYEIGTHIKRYQDTGAFVIYAGCDAAKLMKTLETVARELHRIRHETVPARELQRAKDFYDGQLVLGLEDTLDHMLWAGEQAMMIGRVGTPRELIDAVNRVGADQVRQAARSVFAGPQTHLAVIGPVPAERQQELRKLCEGLR